MERWEARFRCLLLGFCIRDITTLQEPRLFLLSSTGKTSSKYWGFIQKVPKQNKKNVLTSFSFTKFIVSLPYDAWHRTEQVTGCLNLQTSQGFDLMVQFTSLAVQLLRKTGGRPSKKEVHFHWPATKSSFCLLMYHYSSVTSRVWASWLQTHTFCFQKGWASTFSIQFT